MGSELHLSPRLGIDNRGSVEPLTPSGIHLSEGYRLVGGGIWGVTTRGRRRGAGQVDRYYRSIRDVYIHPQLPREASFPSPSPPCLLPLPLAAAGYQVSQALYHTEYFLS